MLGFATLLDRWGYTAGVVASMQHWRPGFLYRAALPVVGLAAGVDPCRARFAWWLPADLPAAVDLLERHPDASHDGAEYREPPAAGRGRWRRYAADAAECAALVAWVADRASRSEATEPARLYPSPVGERPTAWTTRDRHLAELGAEAVTAGGVRVVQADSVGELANGIRESLQIEKMVAQSRTPMGITLRCANSQQQTGSRHGQANSSTESI
jgi:hypothetical protein